MASECLNIICIGTVNNQALEETVSVLIAFDGYCLASGEVCPRRDRPYSLRVRSAVFNHHSLVTAKERLCTKLCARASLVHFSCDAVRILSPASDAHKQEKNGECFHGV